MKDTILITIIILFNKGKYARTINNSFFQTMTSIKSTVADFFHVFRYFYKLKFIAVTEGMVPNGFQSFWK